MKDKSRFNTMYGYSSIPTKGKKLRRSLSKVDLLKESLRIIYKISHLVSIILLSTSIASARDVDELGYSIEHISYYSDGGTVSLHLVGPRIGVKKCGFDGRAQIGDCSQPRCMFVGADHMTQEGARSLELWGEEEEQLVETIWRAINDSLSTSTIGLLENARGASSVPEGISNGMWNLVRIASRRRSILRGIKEGLLSSRQNTLSYFGLEPPLAIDGIKQNKEEDSYTITIRSGSGRRVSVARDVGMDACAWTYSVGRGSREAEFGCHGSELLITLLQLALRGTNAEERRRLGHGTIIRLHEEIECCRDHTLKFFRASSHLLKPKDLPCHDSD